ncbi:molybdenum cofactor guanylyltransferase [Colwellia asteriadis]|uniref:Molybdenum cofactor guanylyltransferase n=2 Tax=Colwellia asteriadis TaxID=517723 RepID=A0ABP3WLU7_9GAMM
MHYLKTNTCNSAQVVNNQNTQHLIAMQNANCLGVILAGGLSSRMGQDKSQLMHNRDNISMLDYSKKLLKSSGIEHIITSGDKHQVADIIPQAGPVGGIYSVLSHFTGPVQPKGLLILPVDLPLMSAKALTELRIKGELSQKATYFTDSQGSNHHIPLYLPNNAYLALFLEQAFQNGFLTSQKNASQSDVNSFTKSNIKNSHESSPKSKKNGPSIKQLLSKVPSQAITCTHDSALFNTNTPQQWQQANQYL